MKKKLMITALVFALLSFGFISGFFVKNNNVLKGVLITIFIVCISIASILGIIVMIMESGLFINSFTNDNLADQELKLYTLKNPRYHRTIRDNSSADVLATTGSLDKHRGYSRKKGVSILKKLSIVLAFMVAVLLALLPTIFLAKIPFYYGLIPSGVVGIIVAIYIFFPRKGYDIQTDNKIYLFEKLENEKDFSLAHHMIYKRRYYFEIDIENARCYFEITNNSIKTYILDTKALEYRAKANSLLSEGAIITPLELDEELDGVLALGKKYVRTFDANAFLLSRGKESLIIYTIKDIIKEYKSRKPSILEKIALEKRKKSSNGNKND